jgi:hypothetical protein
VWDLSGKNKAPEQICYRTNKHEQETEGLRPRFSLYKTQCASGALMTGKISGRNKEHGTDLEKSHTRCKTRFFPLTTTRDYNQTTEVTTLPPSFDY